MSCHLLRKWMMIGGLICLIFWNLQGEESKRCKPIILENNGFRLGILLQAGGRIVEYRAPNGPNILLVDPEMWTEEKIPQPSPDAPWVAFNGHIYWIGPQEEWWNHQTVNPHRKGGWPPDPYLIYGRYTVLEQKPDYLKIQGPISPVCGLQLTQEFWLYPEGRVLIKVSVQNKRETDVAWDIWSNTRIKPEYWAYVPLHTQQKGRIWFGEFSTDQPYLFCPPRYTYEGGFFSFLSGSLPRGYQRQYGKAFIQEPRLGYIAAIIEDYVFIKRTNPVPPELQAPRQAFIEIYTHRDQEGKDGLLELEMHGIYHRLRPGDTMIFEEEWFLFPYQKEKHNRATHISRILEIERLLYPQEPPPPPPPHATPSPLLFD